MEISRVSRKLSYSDKKITEQDAPLSEAQARKSEIPFSADEMKAIFQSEMDVIIAAEINEQKRKLTAEFQEKYDKEIKKYELKIRSEEKKLEMTAKSLQELIATFSKESQEFLSREIVNLDGVLIEIVMEALYKILGENKTYRKSVDAVLSSLIKKVAANQKVSLKVSENTYIFLASLYDDNSILDCLSKDSSLSDGQLVLDDGNTISEVGLLDQLEVIKSIFIAQLRDNHGL